MYWCISFFLGVCVLQFFYVLPNLFWLLIFVPGVCEWYFLPEKGYAKIILQHVCIAGVGFFWALLYASWIASWELPKDLESKPFIITGYIASLPENQLHFTSFNFKVANIAVIKQGLFSNHHPKFKLSWYGEHPVLNVGDRWQLQVRLKRPHGTLNPGGFDFEKYLFQNHFRATGYVVNSQFNQPQSSNWYSYPLARWRQHVQIGIDHALYNQPLVGIINTLVVGDESGITQAQWQIFRNTGTSYLMAISGLHIGLVGGLIFLLMKFLCRCSIRLLLFLPDIQAAAVFGLIAAIFYSLISGLSIPTQRALIMLVVFSCAVLLRRNIQTWNALLFALFLVLILDPLAVLASGFWLSFAAVAVIIYGSSGRVKLNSVWWRKHWRMQLIVTIGLMPLTLLLFQQISLVSIIANIIAMPAVCLIVVPLSLIGASLLSLSAYLGGWVLGWAEKLMELVWMWLHWWATFSGCNWYHSVFNWWVLVTATVGILLLLAPRGLMVRWLGAVWFLPLIFHAPAKPKQGEMWFSLLDVGQGLASVVRTQNHTLIFDTGPKQAKTDAGENVVVPFLRSAGINAINLMVVSHGDLDHIGGANSILNLMKVDRIATSVPDRFSNSHVFAQNCYEGQKWRWDGIDFQFLSPPSSMTILDNQTLTANNASCVLHISNGKNSILLTGDIEKPTENNLVQTEAQNLKATILVAPHHGSATSSTSAFIAKVNPQYVLFPIGYLNRFHFPAKSVVNRYLQKFPQLQLFDTAHGGAITFKITDDETKNLSPELYRKEHRHYWNS